MFLNFYKKIINIFKTQLSIQAILVTFLLLWGINNIKTNTNVQYFFSKAMGFTEPANDVMYSIILLLTEMTLLLSFIFLGVFFVLMLIVIMFNAEKNPYPRHFEKTVESTLDVLFVIFPTIIIIYLLVPSLGFIFNNETIVETVFSLDIVGHQWYWSYEYHLPLGNFLYGLFTNESNMFNTLEFDSLLEIDTNNNRLLSVDKRVIIPVNTLIQGTVTAQDVIHSWAVPQLGIKYDAIPGRLISFIIESNVLGIFYGQCSELCGVNHAFMPICVQSVDADIFLDWVLVSLCINPSGIILDKLSIPLLLNSNIEVIELLDFTKTEYECSCSVDINKPNDEEIKDSKKMDEETRKAVLDKMDEMINTQKDTAYGVATLIVLVTVLICLIDSKL